MDASGIIEIIGDNTETELRFGDEVMAFVVPNGSHGSYAERIAVSADSVARIPKDTSLIEASTLPMSGLTARLALDTLNRPRGRPSTRPVQPEHSRDASSNLPKPQGSPLLRVLPRTTPVSLPSVTTKVNESEALCFAAG